MRIVACLNGDRRPEAHPALPVSSEQVVAEARAAVEAGADEIHVHPRDGAGAESLEPQAVAPLLRLLRAELPDVPVSVTTALSSEPDPVRRYDLVQRWSALPDSAAVNLHEPGSVEVCRLLIDRRVGVEAGVWTPEAARILVASGLAEEFLRILVEPMQTATEDALANASSIDGVLDRAGLDLPRLLHGRDRTAWPVLETAVAAGRGVRIGLEDTLRDPDGNPATGNAGLVELALARTSAAA
ncbi:3-keto-5-aminohexanoate cleavage protein [Streptomonospora salina]|uniref:Uncharacterized protein (DUF849 family) n=3 Tax=Nocardiopsidaceae TaxID=83676 RepID=A0A841EDR2_9ACTN|nr:3-keto-5-aminohexanoate cleavage protein [Streptomonospora salina]MBB5999183.1 uncharacterized protein (DUF849 family) [Streptomonospora salina]